MTKENQYFTGEDDSDDSSDASKERSKKTTKISRAVPLPVSLETDGSAEKVEAKPVLSFGERFMQELQRRSAREQEHAHEGSAEAEEEEDDEDDDEAPASNPAPATHPSDTNTEEVPETTIEPETTRTLDGADWEAEPAPVTEVVEDTTDFAELPVEEGAAEVELVPPTEDIEPELLETGLASEAPVDILEPEVEQPIHPEFGPGGRSSMIPVQESAWYNPVARERAAEQDHDDAVYRAEKHGLKRGLTAGLLFGWMFGRRGKKEAAERHQKEQKLKDKEIKALKNEQLLAQQRLEAVQRTQQSIRGNIAEKTPAPVRKPENAARGPLEPKEADAYTTKQEMFRSPETAEKPRLSAAEIVAMAAAEVVAVTENIHPAAEEEPFSASSEKQKPNQEAPKMMPEKQPLPIEEQEITEDTYLAPKDRRVESSAWHRIEVDAKTGRPVLDPEVAYGEEFKREQRQEIWKDKPGDADPKSSAGVLGSLVAGVTAAGVSAASQDVYNAANSEQGLAVPREHDLHSDLHRGSGLVAYASSPIVWAVALVVVVFLFIVGFVL